MRKIRFHLDESVHGAVAAYLRSKGIEVSTAAEANLIGASDSVQLAYAKSTDSVLVTFDDDFARLHAQDQRHAGIGYCHQGKYGIGDFSRLLVLLYECYEAADLAGKFEYL